MEYHVPIFNPGRNLDQVSLLRLVNARVEYADITIGGVDTREGFLRIRNKGAARTVRLSARDDTARDYGSVDLALETGETVHLNSNDLELGNEKKGRSPGLTTTACRGEK